jgi:hypothetical protein
VLSKIGLVRKFRTSIVDYGNGPFKMRAWSGDSRLTGWTPAVHKNQSFAIRSRAGRESAKTYEFPARAAGYRKWVVSREWQKTLEITGKLQTIKFAWRGGD